MTMFVPISCGGFNRLLNFRKGRAQQKIKIIWQFSIKTARTKLKLPIRYGAGATPQQPRNSKVVQRGVGYVDGICHFADAGRRLM